MKVACISNLNQMQFVAARYLRDLGHDVTLFLIEEYDHFLPENDTHKDIKDIKVVNLTWTSEGFWDISKNEIEKTFEPFEFLIGGEWAPAFLARINRTLDVFIPLGTDLIYYPFQYGEYAGYLFWKWRLKYKSRLQHLGILNSGAIYVNKNGDMNLEEAMERMKFDPQKRVEISLPSVYLKDYELATNNETYLGVSKRIEEIKAENDFIFVSPNRISYCDDSIHNKGTDILLKGIAKYRKETKAKFCLFLIEYGADIKAAKNLIKELDIEDCIAWLPIMPRKVLWPILKMFNIGFGNLKQVSYLSGLSMEMASAGLPIIQLGADTTALPESIAIPPHYRVSSDSEICAKLLSLEKDKFSKEARLVKENWYEEKVVKPSYEILMAQIERKKTNPKKVNTKLKRATSKLQKKDSFLSKIAPLVYKFSKV